MFLPSNRDSYDTDELIVNTHPWELAILTVMTFDRKGGIHGVITNPGMYFKNFLQYLCKSTLAVVKLLALQYTANIGVFAEQLAALMVSDKRWLTRVHMASCCVLGGTRQLLIAFKSNASIVPKNQKTLADMTSLIKFPKKITKRSTMRARLANSL